MKKPTTSMRTQKARSLHAVDRRVVCVRWLKAKMPRYVVPSIHDSADYCKGYSDAVTELHNILNSPIAQALPRGGAEGGSNVK